MKKLNIFHIPAAIILLLCMAAFLSGCEGPINDMIEDEKYYNDITDNGTDEISDYVDPETGVHYLLYDGYEGCGICVRYNADGTIMVDQHPEDR